MRDRAASDADDGDFSVDNATITAGNDSATATLMVTEDMEPDSGTNDNMGEVLVLYGKVNGEDINSLTFTIWGSGGTGSAALWPVAAGPVPDAGRGAAVSAAPGLASRLFGDLLGGHGEGDPVRMRRIPFHFIGVPRGPGLSNKFRAISRRSLGKRVLTTPVHRFVCTAAICAVQLCRLGAGCAACVYNDSAWPVHPFSSRS